MTESGSFDMHGGPGFLNVKNCDDQLNVIVAANIVMAIKSGLIVQPGVCDGRREALLQVDVVEHGCAGAGAHDDPVERRLANVFPRL